MREHGPQEDERRAEKDERRDEHASPPASRWWRHGCAF
jgi:hypothetical protein